ncbi:MAG: hypothetical protein N2559_15965, partial [Anaerolineae bacterium]|nr:hypothetical protein [Anaerolineae bacterium]
RYTLLLNSSLNDLQHGADTACSAGGQTNPYSYREMKAITEPYADEWIIDRAALSFSQNYIGIMCAIGEEWRLSEGSEALHPRLPFRWTVILHLYSQTPIYPEVFKRLPDDAEILGATALVTMSDCAVLKYTVNAAFHLEWRDDLPYQWVDDAGGGSKLVVTKDTADTAALVVIGVNLDGSFRVLSKEFDIVEVQNGVARVCDLTKTMRTVFANRNKGYGGGFYIVPFDPSAIGGFETWQAESGYAGLRNLIPTVTRSAQLDSEGIASSFSYSATTRLFK